MSSDPLNNRQWPRPEEESSTSKSYALSGKIMLTSIIILFVVVIFLVLLHLYARWYLLRLHRRNHSTRRRNRRNRSSRIIFTVDNNHSPSTGLALSVLNTLPLFIYSEKNGDVENDETAPECAVCLAVFEEGEEGRLLPKCKHSFHTECIDMWFFSHSTCPLCRSAVEPVEIDPVQPETTSDMRKGIDVRIDIPSRSELVTETELPSHGFKSPGGSRLLSFKRIISMSLRSPVMSPSSGVGTSSLSVTTESDIESSGHESTQSETGILR